jgi:hypothetical protein
MATRVIYPEPHEMNAARRLLTALVHEWAGLPQGRQRNLMGIACLAHDPDLTLATTSLDHDLVTFIRKYAALPPPGG